MPQLLLLLLLLLVFHSGAWTGVDTWCEPVVCGVPPVSSTGTTPQCGGSSFNQTCIYICTTTPQFVSPKHSTYIFPWLLILAVYLFVLYDGGSSLRCKRPVAAREWSQVQLQLVPPTHTALRRAARLRRGCLGERHLQVSLCASDSSLNHTTVTPLAHVSTNQIKLCVCVTVCSTLHIRQHLGLVFR